jgi:alkylated DNA repair dioxygenase AlkB
MPGKRSGEQEKLFDTATALPNGLVYRPGFITEAEEKELLWHFDYLPLREARFKEYTAKRRIVGFGYGYDYKLEKIVPGPPLPHFLQPAARRIEKWLDIGRGKVVEALISEYRPGTAIGWHRDNEKFEHIIGISLGGWCRMRWRPLRLKERSGRSILSMELEPRSAYIMQNEIRWEWQHSIPPTRAHRYSITFRTLPARYRP